LSVQWELWNGTDKKQYVANPRYGSNHNRGAAVDLTLVNAQTGEQLDMGTTYDFFGKKAHHSYQNLSSEVLARRKLLKTVLYQYGFTSINSEWWHYNYFRKYPVSDHPLDCD
ncbi:MAG: M15 family metallopeptidase, partial [Bacteroidota bacterium]